MYERGDPHKELSVYKGDGATGMNELAVAILRIQDAQAMLKKYRAIIEDELHTEMMTTHTTKFEEGDLSVCLSKKKKERFFSEKIKGFAENGPPDTRALALRCYPPNPAFRKGQVKLLMEKTGELLNWQEIEDGVKVTMIPTALLNQEKGGVKDEV